MNVARWIPVVAALTLVSLTGCAADEGQSTTNDDDVTAGGTAAAKALKADLEKAANGLIVISETDSPLSYVEAPLRRSEAITPELIVAKLDATHTKIAGDDLGKLSERFANPVDFEAFFKDEADVAEDAKQAQQWRDLAKLMRDKLADRVAIRFQSVDPKEGSDGGTISLFLGGRANGRLVGFFVELAET
jgi:hypothetical protein